MFTVVTIAATRLDVGQEKRHRHHQGHRHRGRQSRNRPHENSVGSRTQDHQQDIRLAYVVNGKLDDIRDRLEIHVTTPKSLLAMAHEASPQRLGRPAGNKHEGYRAGSKN